MKNIVNEIDNIIEGLTNIIGSIDDLSYDDMITVEDYYPLDHTLADHINSFKEWKKSMHIYEVNLSFHENPNPVINGLRKYVYSYKLQQLSIEDCREALFEYVNKYKITKDNFKGGELYKRGEYIGYLTYEGELQIEETSS